MPPRRLEGEPLAVKILNQIGYDTVFGAEVEKYIFPRVTSFMDAVGSLFGLGKNPENRTGIKRNGVLITPNTDLK